MFAYRERRLRAPAIAGAAEVQFLTAGNVEFKADLRDECGGRVCDCPTGAPFGANEEQADAGQHINTGNKKCAGSGVPIPSRGLEIGQPPETVRGGHDRQLAWLPVSTCS